VELATCSGSTHEFKSFVVRGDHFWHGFLSGPLRPKPHEFGFKFRVTPLGWAHASEEALLRRPIGGAWTLLALLIENPIMAKAALVTSQSGMILLTSLLQYLTLARSPHKAFIARAVTAHCMQLMATDKGRQKLQQSHATSLFPSLVLMVDKLHQSSTASPWGYGAVLHAVVDLLCAVRPLDFDVDPSDIWGALELSGHDSHWFMIGLFRAHALASCLWQQRALPSPNLVLRAYRLLDDLEVLRWCLKQPEICLKLTKQVLATSCFVAFDNATVHALFADNPAIPMSPLHRRRTGRRTGESG
jgi:hypothetical protein